MMEVCLVGKMIVFEWVAKVGLRIEPWTLVIGCLVDADV